MPISRLMMTRCFLMQIMFFSNLDIFTKVFESLKIPVTLSLSGSFLAYYKDAVRNFLAHDQNLYDLLVLIKKSNYSLGIISDGTVVEQLEILTRLGIIHLFDHITISQAVGFEKLDYRIFRSCFEGLKIKPNQALVIGDNCDRDILGAKSMGARTSLIRNNFQIQLFVLPIL